MPTPVPRVVKKLAREEDPKKAKMTLRKIATSKKAWATSTYSVMTAPVGTSARASNS